MKKIFLLLIIPFSLLTLHCQAQGQHKKDSLFTALKTANEDTNKVMLLYEYAYTMDRSLQDSFIYYLREALMLSKKTDCNETTMWIYWSMANYHSSNSATDSAIFYAMMCMATAKELNDSIWIGHAFLKLSLLELNISNANLPLGWKKGMMYLDSAISYANNDKVILSAAYGRKSEIYIEQKKFDDAKYFLQQAINLGPDGHANIFLLTTFASILTETGRLDSALTIYNSILEQDKIKPVIDVAMKSYLYAMIANAYMKLKNYKVAVANGETGLKLAIDNNLTKERLDNLSTLYQIYLSKKDFEKALDYYKQHTEFSDSLNSYKSKSSETSFQNQIKAEKNQQQIIVLEKDNEKQKLVRNGFIGGIFLMLVVAFVIFYNYKKQQTLNNQLNEANHTLKETQQQLIASERMAAFGSVATRMAHEIQNPLNFVNNFSELSEELVEEIISATSEEEKNDAAKTLTENLQKINHHGKRAAEIVKQLQEHTNRGTAHEYFEEEI